VQARLPGTSAVIVRRKGKKKLVHLPLVRDDTRGDIRRPLRSLSGEGRASSARVLHRVLSASTPCRNCPLRDDTCGDMRRPVQGLSGEGRASSARVLSRRMPSASTPCRNYKTVANAPQLLESQQSLHTRMVSKKESQLITCKLN